MRIALVGYTGYWGEKLARVVGKLGHKVVQWVDQSNSEELGRESADAAIIATPPATHYKLAMQAMKAGMDVLVEKPMTLDAAQAFEMAAYAKKNGIVLSVDSTFLHTASFDYLRQINQPFLSYQSLRMAPPMPQAKIAAGWDLVCHDVAILLGLGMGPTCPGIGVEDGSVANAVFALPAWGSAFIMASRSWPTKVREITVHYPGESFLWTLDGLFTLNGTTVLQEKEEPLKRLLLDFDARCQQRQIGGKTDGLHGAEVVGCLERLFPHDETVGLRPSGMGNGLHHHYPDEPIQMQDR